MKSARLILFVVLLVVLLACVSQSTLIDEQAFFEGLDELEDDDALTLAEEMVNNLSNNNSTRSTPTSRSNNKKHRSHDHDHDHDHIEDLEDEIDDLKHEIKQLKQVVEQQRKATVAALDAAKAATLLNGLNITNPTNSTSQTTNSTTKADPKTFHGVNERLSIILEKFINGRVQTEQERALAALKETKKKGKGFKNVMLKKKSTLDSFKEKFSTFFQRLQGKDVQAIKGTILDKKMKREEIRVIAKQKEFNDKINEAMQKIKDRIAIEHDPAKEKILEDYKKKLVAYRMKVNARIQKQIKKRKEDIRHRFRKIVKLNRDRIRFRTMRNKCKNKKLCIERVNAQEKAFFEKLRQKKLALLEAQKKKKAGKRNKKGTKKNTPQTLRQAQRRQSAQISVAKQEGKKPKKSLLSQLLEKVQNRLGKKKQQKGKKEEEKKKPKIVEKKRGLLRKYFRKLEKKKAAAKQSKKPKKNGKKIVEKKRGLFRKLFKNLDKKKKKDGKKSKKPKSSKLDSAKNATVPTNTTATPTPAKNTTSSLSAADQARFKQLVADMNSSLQKTAQVIAQKQSNVITAAKLIKPTSTSTKPNKKPTSTKTSKPKRRRGLFARLLDKIRQKREQRRARKAAQQKKMNAEAEQMKKLSNNKKDEAIKSKYKSAVKGLIQQYKFLSKKDQLSKPEKKLKKRIAKIIHQISGLKQASSKAVKKVLKQIDLASKELADQLKALPKDEKQNLIRAKLIRLQKAENKTKETLTKLMNELDKSSPAVAK